MALGIEKQILRLDVSVGDTLTVEVKHAIEDLFETAFHFAWAHTTEQKIEGVLVHFLIMKDGRKARKYLEQIGATAPITQNSKSNPREYSPQSILYPRVWVSKREKKAEQHETRHFISEDLEAHKDRPPKIDKKTR